ncbi:ABC transporter permease [Thermodesulfobacteriota bacterium]
MSNQTEVDAIVALPPSLITRLYSVWYRHFRVYTNNLFSNAFPPFIEPLIFLVGVGLGLGHYVGLVDGTPYMLFLAAGIIAPPAMFTASFECTYGTFIRLEWGKAYDGMISSSITVKDLFIGEMIFAGTKGLFFSFAVMVVVYAFGLIQSPVGILTPIAGFFTGLMFAALALYVTSFVTTINHFNFFFTGIITPMFFFSGIVFPLSDLPKAFRVIAEFCPLTHTTRVMRAMCFNDFQAIIVFDVVYFIVFTLIFGFLAIRRLERRIIT